jgi:glycosyltransferase 2 family protein
VSSPDPAGRRTRLRLGLALGLGLALSTFLGWRLLRRIDLGRVLPLIADAHVLPLVAMMGSKLVGFLGLTWRVRALLRPFRELTMGVAFQGQLLGFAANNVIPFRAGELVKVDYLARRGGDSRSAVLAVAATERILDALCLLGLFALVSPLVLPRIGHPGAVAASAVAVAAASACGWLIATRAASWVRGFRALEAWLGLREGGRLSGAASSFSLGLAAFRSPGVLASGLAGTVVYWASAFVSVQLCLEAFGTDTPWYAPAVVLVFLAFGTALPASPGFVGTYDYFFVAALLVFGVEANRAASAALVTHTLSIVPFTIVGFLVVPGSLRELSFRLRSLATPAPAPPAGAAAGGTS